MEHPVFHLFSIFIFLYFIIICVYVDVQCLGAEGIVTLRTSITMCSVSRTSFNYVERYNVRRRMYLLSNIYHLAKKKDIVNISCVLRILLTDNERTLLKTSTIFTNTHWLT